MRYAYVKDGVALESVAVDPLTIFEAGYAAQFIQVPDDVRTGWFLQGEVWTEPVAPEPAEPIPVVKTLTRLAMMSRFTDSELGAIYTAAKSDVGVEIWLDRFKMSEEIDPADPRTQQGLQMLVERALLQADRVAELLQ